MRASRDRSPRVGDRGAQAEVFWETPEYLEKLRFQPPLYELDDHETSVLERVRRRVQSDTFDLPPLPSTTTRAMLDVEF